MTREEFSNTKFGANMKCTYRGETWPIIKVDFIEDLIAIPDEHGIVAECDSQLQWVRCENVNLKP